MNVKIKFRLAVETDWREISELEKLAKGKYYSTGTTKKDILNYINSQTILLAYINSEIIGKISYLNNGDSVLISGLVVAHSWRGNGFGKCLTKHVLNKLTEIKRFTATIHPENVPSLKIFSKLGFNQVDHVDNYYGDNEPRIILEYISKLSK